MTNLLLVLASLRARRAGAGRRCGYPRFGDRPGRSQSAHAPRSQDIAGAGC
jgi:hypothetical protein